MIKKNKEQSLLYEAHTNRPNLMISYFQAGICLVEVESPLFIIVNVLTKKAYEVRSECLSDDKLRFYLTLNEFGQCISDKLLLKAMKRQDFAEYLVKRSSFWNFYRKRQMNSENFQIKALNDLVGVVGL